MSILYLTFCMLIVHSKEFECDQRQGNYLYNKGEYKSAFENLKRCEFLYSVSGLTLVQLAFLYGRFDFDNILIGSNKNNRVYTLIKRAALKGNRDAISLLIESYKTGLPSLDLAPRPKAAMCFENLLKKDIINISDLTICVEILDERL